MNRKKTSTQLGYTASHVSTKDTIKVVHVWQSWEGKKYEKRHTYRLPEFALREFITLYEMLSDLVGFFAITIGESDDFLFMDTYPTKEMEKRVREYWNTHD